VKQQKGRIDVLFANAGVADVAPLGSITESHLTKYSISTFSTDLAFMVQPRLLYDQFPPSWTVDLKNCNATRPGPIAAATDKRRLGMGLSKEEAVNAILDL
jgi:NAD(P)-dependent dehydrogenase (short-subunit alcohol dehydrogenase family)